MAQNKNNPDTFFNPNWIPLKYVTEARSSLIAVEKYPQALNYWFKVPQDKLNAITECIYIAMRGIIIIRMQTRRRSLMMTTDAHYGHPKVLNALPTIFCNGTTDDKSFDDIQDGTLYRRNLPATNRVYGEALTLNSSIYAVGKGFQKALCLGHPMAPSVFCNLFIGYMEGTGLEIYWRDNYICPTEDELLAMLEKKSGSFYLLQYSLMQLFSEDKRDLRDFINLFGTYMQIKDDYCNLVKVAAFEEKSRVEEFKNLGDLLFCEDITEGRFSLPLVHALKSSEGPTIRSILVKHTRDFKIKQYCLTLLEKAGSLEYTRQTLLDMEKKLREQLERLGGNPIFTDLLDEVNNWNNE